MSSAEASRHPGTTAMPGARLSAGLDRFTWAVGIGALILIVVGIVVAVVVGRSQPPPDLSTPGGVTLAYELAIQRGEADSAWKLLSSTAQASVSEQQYLARAAGIGRQPDARFSIENVRVVGDRAYLDLVRVIPSGGMLGLGAGTFTVRDPVTLDREGGQWRITVPPEPFLIVNQSGGPVP